MDGQRKGRQEVKERMPGTSIRCCSYFEAAAVKLKGWVGSPRLIWSLWRASRDHFRNIFGQRSLMTCLILLKYELLPAIIFSKWSGLWIKWFVYNSVNIIFLSVLVQSLLPLNAHREHDKEKWRRQTRGTSTKRGLGYVSGRQNGRAKALIMVLDVARLIIKKSLYTVLNFS